MRSVFVFASLILCACGAAEAGSEQNPLTEVSKAPRTATAMKRSTTAATNLMPLVEPRFPSDVVHQHCSVVDDQSNPIFFDYLRKPSGNRTQNWLEGLVAVGQQHVRLRSSSDAPFTFTDGNLTVRLEQLGSSKQTSETIFEIKGKLHIKDQDGSKIIPVTGACYRLDASDPTLFGGIALAQASDPASDANDSTSSFKVSDAPGAGGGNTIASSDGADKKTGFGPTVAGVRLGEGISRFLALERAAQRERNDRSAVWADMRRRGYLQGAIDPPTLSRSPVQISRSFGGTQVRYKDARLLAGCDGKIYKIEYTQRGLRGVESSALVKALTDKYGRPRSNGGDTGGTGFWLIWNSAQLPSHDTLLTSIQSIEWLGTSGRESGFNTRGIDGLSVWIDAGSRGGEVYEYGLTSYSETLGDAAQACFNSNVDKAEAASKTKLGF